MLLKVALGLAVAGALYIVAGKAKNAIGAASDAAWRPVADFGEAVNSYWTGATHAAGNAWDYTASAANTAWDTAGSAAQAVNPTSNQNAIYTGVGHLFGTDSIGSSLYDWLNPSPPPMFASGGGGNFAGNGATGSW